MYAGAPPKAQNTLGMILCTVRKYYVLAYDIAYVS
jgi:hypothetical protein